MTLIELSFFCVNILLAVILGSYGWAHYSWIGLIVGGIVGIILLPLSTKIIMRVFPGRRPRHPICSNGLCSEKDYTWIRQVGSIPVCKCRCGTEFVHKGKCFVRVGTNDVFKPYMVWDKKK